MTTPAILTSAASYRTGGPLRSVGAKIFAVAAGLLIVMMVLAVAAAFMARIVGEELGILEDHYVTAYAALERADSHSLEEALAIRRFVLHSRNDPEKTEQNRTYRQQVDVAHDRTLASLAEAREHLGETLADSNRFHDEAALARLDAQLEILEQDYGRRRQESAPLLAAVAEGDWDAAHAELIREETSRDLINARLDAYAAQMRDLLEHAVNAARRFQAAMAVTNLALASIATVLGLIAAALITRSLVRPVRALVAGAQRIEQGSLDVELPVSSRDEIGQLTASFNVMAEELRKKERIRETFGRYMDPRIVEGLLDRPDLAHAEGERRVMTVLFCDMQGFTGLGERLTPSALLTVINRYLTLLSEPVRQHDGVIDKYIGDAIMAFWGPPFVAPERQAALACEAALGMLERLEQFRAELPELLGLRGAAPPVDVRIGIATGEMLVGSLGSEFTKSYSVLGDSVNLAARLEAANKTYGSRILISDQTRAMLGEQFAVREIDLVRVMGKAEPERVFELYGPAADARADRDTAFAEALAAYRRGEWAAARRLFEQTGDSPAAALLGRIAELERATPAEWDGVWTMTGK